MRPRTHLVLRMCSSALVGLAYPFAELAWKCRAGQPGSEACVWAKAYFPMSRWVEPLIVAPVAFAVLWAVARVVGRRRESP